MNYETVPRDLKIEIDYLKLRKGDVEFDVKNQNSSIAFFAYGV